MKLRANVLMKCLFKCANYKMIIYHNQRCSKSREVLALLEKSKVDYTVREYLKETLNKKEIKELLRLLKCKAKDIVRVDENVFKEKFAGKKLSESQYIKLLSENPILIQRPILRNADKAVIGRPIEVVVEFLKEIKK